jgi:CRISPR/Cas system CSM-associated protein Csm2 small subunit
MMNNSREEILAELNTLSILIRKLWEEVFNETINNNEWNEIKIRVVKLMRHE